MYVSPPSITTVRPWFATIGYSGEIRAKVTLKKSCLPPRWRLLMGQIIQCLGGKTGGLDQISNKDATILYCLATGVEVDYAKLIWEDIIHKLSKKSREKVVPYPSIHNWALKPNQTEGPPFTDHMNAICNLDVPMDSKAPKPSSQTKEVPQGKKPVAKKKETQSSLAKDKSPIHPSPPTPVVGEMHKEAQQAAGDPTSLGATSEEGAHPQLSRGHDASVDSTTEADPGLSASNYSIPTQQDQAKSARDWLKTAHTDSGTNEESKADDISKKIKLEDLSDLYLPSLLLTPYKMSQSLFQMRVKRKRKLQKIKTLMLLLMIIKELKKHVQDMEIELPRDLKEIPTKLKTFTSTVFSLSSQVAELKNIQWELPVEFQAQVSSVQKKIKTLDSLSSILNKVTDTLNRFSTVVENASGATTKGVPSAVQATALPAEEEKNTNPATTDVEPNLHNELVDLLGIDIMTQYYNKKLLYDKYYDKMLKRRKSSKIINCDVLTQKGPITMQVYMEDGTVEVISNVKFSDLHLAEWKEVVQACPDRKEKGWKTIYGLIKTRMEYLDQTEKELEIDFNKPLKEQDPLKKN
ncbi:hypothetical protein Tco_0986315 [Tanacetum coccineum]